MFEIGNKVKIIGVAKGHESDKEFNSYIGREGVVIELIDKAGYWPIRVQFKESEDYQGFHDYCLELIQENKEMPAKFKIGDTVKVTASKEELKAIGALGAFGLEGKVIDLHSVMFVFRHSGDAWWNLNYAHAELVKEKTEPKFKNGDLVRGVDSGELYVVSCYNQDGNLVVLTQQTQYDKNPKRSVLPDSKFELVTELEVGDRVALPPSIVEIVSVENINQRDFKYRIMTSIGTKHFLANELAPNGTCVVPSKFELGEVVLYKDDRYEGIGTIKADDYTLNCRYRIEMGKDDSRNFHGNELTKIPQDMFPELRNILKEK